MGFQHGYLPVSHANVTGTPKPLVKDNCSFEALKLTATQEITYSKPKTISGWSHSV